MLVFIIRRCVQSVAVLLLMSLLVFVSVYAIGNPIDIPRRRPDRAGARDRCIRAGSAAYFYFIKNALTGDMGRSFVYATPVLGLILERLPATLELAVSAILIAIVIGLPLPIFWVGLMLIMLFAVQLGWLPTSGRGQTTLLLGIPVGFLTLDGLRHLLMPALNLLLFNIALIIRLTRAGTQEALLQDYIKFARAKGLSNSRIVGVHVLKNILIPIVTVVALQSGSIIAFSIPRACWPTGSISCRLVLYPAVGAQFSQLVFRQHTKPARYRRRAASRYAS